MILHGLSILSYVLLLPLVPIVALATDVTTVSNGGAVNVPPMAVVRSSGAIEADVDAFRLLLGNPLNLALPGQQPSGRREINWDGVPASLTNNAKFPLDFFNVNSPRGLIYEPTSRALEVSSNSFSNIEPAYAGEFLPFSGTKLFSPLGTNDSDVRFVVAGSDAPATVRGFGVVFSDIDVDGQTFFVAFDVDGNQLGVFRADKRSDARGLSFLGVAFRSAVIARVHIHCGTGALAAGELDVSDGGTRDLVVMDDFLYGEPTLVQ
jgi:hypothetical protein